MSAAEFARSGPGAARPRESQGPDRTAEDVEQTRRAGGRRTGRWRADRRARRTPVHCRSAYDACACSPMGRSRADAPHRVPVSAPRRREAIIAVKKPPTPTRTNRPKHADLTAQRPAVMRRQPMRPSAVAAPPRVRPEPATARAGGGTLPGGSAAAGASAPQSHSLARQRRSRCCRHASSLAGWQRCQRGVADAASEAPHGRAASRRGDRGRACPGTARRAR